MLRLTPSVGTRKPRLRLNVERDRELVADNTRQAIRDCCDGKTAWPLLLYGGVGTGKTCAALCLCDAVAGGCVFYTVSELVTKVHLATYGDLRIDDGVSGRPPRVWPHEIWREWRDAELGVLDDLGTRDRVTDARYETIKRALDERCDMPLVLTSNLDTGELSQVYDDRLASRCGGGTVCEVGGPDRRMT